MGALYKVTSSVVLHDPFTTVQRMTVVPPTVTPVTVDVGEFGVVIEPGPLTMIHVPVPGEAVLPARVNVVVLSQ